MPGDTRKSELFRRITAEDESERMPPAKSGHRLSLNQVELIRRLMQLSVKLKAAGVPVTVDLPAARRQRECQVILLSLVDTNGRLVQTNTQLGYQGEMYLINPTRDTILSRIRRT